VFVTGALLSVVLTVSPRFRCYTALVVPCIGTTSSGRSGYLLFLTVALIAGPLANIGVNVREVARSLACSAELSYNQSRLLSDPYGALLGPLNVTVDGLKKAVGKVCTRSVFIQRILIDTKRMNY